MTKTMKKQKQKPSKTVGNTDHEDFDVQYWSDSEVRDLAENFAQQQYNERNYDDNSYF